MRAAALNRGVLNVLDFGGALGSSYFQNRKFLVGLPRVSWNVVEQPHFVDAGRVYIQDETLRFYKDLDECLIQTSPNVIILSSVLQYIQNPFGLLQTLCSLGAETLIIDRTCYLKTGALSQITVQERCRTVSIPLPTPADFLWKIKYWKLYGLTDTRLLNHSIRLTVWMSVQNGRAHIQEGLATVVTEQDLNIIPLLQVTNSVAWGEAKHVLRTLSEHRKL